jgi:hypothetical protein
MTSMTRLQRIGSDLLSRNGWAQDVADAIVLATPAVDARGAELAAMGCLEEETAIEAELQTVIAARGLTVSAEDMDRAVMHLAFNYDRPEAA